MQVTAKGSTFQQKMKSLKDVRGYDPVLDMEIESKYATYKSDFWVTFCDMKNYNSWSKWAQDFDYPLQFLSDNPYPQYREVTRSNVKRIFDNAKGSVSNEKIDYSRAGLYSEDPTIKNPTFKTVSKPQPVQEDTNGCFLPFILIGGILIAIMASVL